MGGYSFPPMDNVVMLGDYDRKKAPQWAGTLWPLFSQQHTRLLLNGDLREGLGLSTDHWGCFKSAVLSSLKWRLFSSVHDAHAFRAAAYALADVTNARSYSDYPPRKTMVMDRGTRGIAVH